MPLNVNGSPISASPSLPVVAGAADAELVSRRRHTVLTNDLLRIVRQERKLLHQTMQLMRLLSCFPKPVCLDLTIPHASAVYGGSGLYVTYNVQVRDRSQELAWQCFRRYSDCKELHQRFGGKFCSSIADDHPKQRTMGPEAMGLSEMEAAALASVVSDCRVAHTASGSSPDLSPRVPLTQQIEQLLAVRRVESGPLKVSRLLALQSNVASTSTPPPMHSLDAFAPIPALTPDSIIDKCVELHREKERLLATVQQFTSTATLATSPPSVKGSALAGDPTKSNKHPPTDAPTRRKRAPPVFGAVSAPFPPVLILNKSNRSKIEIERRRAKLEAYLQAVCNNLQSAYHQQLLQWGLRMLEDHGGPNGEADVALGVVTATSSAVVSAAYAQQPTLSTPPSTTKGTAEGLLSNLSKAGGSGVGVTAVPTAVRAASNHATVATNAVVSPTGSQVRAAYMDVGTALDVHYATASTGHRKAGGTTRGSGGTNPESPSSSMADQPATPTTSTTGAATSSNVATPSSAATVALAPPCQLVYSLGDVQPPPHLTPPNLVYLTGLLRFLQYPFIDEWEGCLVTALLPPELVSRASHRHRQQEAQRERSQEGNVNEREEDDSDGGSRYEVNSDVSERGRHRRGSGRRSASSRSASSQDVLAEGRGDSAADRVRRKLDEKRWDRLGGDSSGRLGQEPSSPKELSRASSNASSSSSPPKKGSIFKRFVNAIGGEGRHGEGGEEHIDPRSGLVATPRKSSPSKAPEDGSGVAIRILQAQSMSSVSFSSSQRSFSFDSDLSSVDRCFADTDDLDGAASTGSGAALNDEGAHQPSPGMHQLVTSRWRAPGTLPSPTLGLIMPLVNIHKSIEGTWEVSMRQGDKETRKGRLRHSYDEASAVAAELACRDWLMDANDMQSFVVAFRRKHPVSAYIRVEKALDQTLTASHPASQRDRRGNSSVGSPATPPPPTSKGQQQYQAALRGLAVSGNPHDVAALQHRHTRDDGGFTVVGSPLPHVNSHIAGGSSRGPPVLGAAQGLYEGTEDIAQRRLRNAHRSKFVSPPTQRFPAGFSPSCKSTLFSSGFVSDGVTTASHVADPADDDVTLLTPSELISTVIAGSKLSAATPAVVGAALPTTESCPAVINRSSELSEFMGRERGDPLCYARYLGFLRTVHDQWVYLQRAVEASYLSSIGSHFSLRPGWESASLDLVVAAQKRQRDRFHRIDPASGISSHNHSPTTAPELPSQHRPPSPIQPGEASRYFRPYAKKASSILGSNRPRRKSLFELELEADRSDSDAERPQQEDDLQTAADAVTEAELNDVWSALVTRLSRGASPVVVTEADIATPASMRSVVEKLLAEEAFAIGAIPPPPATSVNPLSTLPFIVAGQQTQQRLMVPTATALFADQIRGAPITDCRCTQDLLCSNQPAGGAEEEIPVTGGGGDVFVTPCGYCLVVCPPPFTTENAPPLYSVI